MKKGSKSIAKVLPLSLLLSTMLQIPVFAADGSIPVPTTVSKITATINGDPSTSEGFTWYTDSTSTNSDLQIVEKKDYTYNFSKATTFTGKSFASTNSPTELVHKAEATQLKENTTYYYRVGDAKLNIWSKTGTFQTAPKSGAFSFVELTDGQAKTEEEATLSSQTISKALSTVSNAKFLTVTGDLVDTGSKEEQWNWLLNHAQLNLLNTTIVPAAGNHESNKNSFMDHFDVSAAPNSDTTKGAYYSYNYSNAHFVVLNNNEDSEEYADFTPAQIQWMKDDVNAAKAAGSQWIIVLMHKGPYTTSNHATDDDIMGANGVRTKVAPIMSELGIDMVLQGHDHIFARSKPINNGEATTPEKITETLNGKTIEYSVNPDGTIYFIPNTAGAKVYYKNSTIDAAFFNNFDVADEHHAAVYGPDPADNTRPLRAQVQNFTGFTIDGSKLTAVSYEIDQNKNNGQPYIIDQFGIVKSEQAQDITFEDMGDSHWANKYVSPLAKKGIIKGVGNGMFEPERNITRAEFVKLLIESIGKKNNQAVSSYSDVPQNQWYYSYIASAQQLNIIPSSENFKPDTAITREEMALYTYNAMRVAGMNLNNENEFTAFNDISTASQNCMTAVQELQKANVLNGYPDGSFKPKGNLSRAEAAKITYLLVNQK